MKKPTSKKSYIDKDGEALELDGQWFAEATYHPGHKAPPKRSVNLRVDAHVLEWFKAQGKGYQTRINHVLATYVRAGERRARKG